MREARGHMFESRQPHAARFHVKKYHELRLYGSREKIFFAIFKDYFSSPWSKKFAEWLLAHSKGFAECLKKGTRQR